LLSFAGTRTQHRMAVNIEDAGFEIRDMIFWTYASGFPKSLNIFKQLSKRCTCGNMALYDKDRNVSGIPDKQDTQYDLRPMQETDISQTINPEKEQGKVLQSGLSEQGLSLSGNTTSNEGSEQSSMEGGSNPQENSRELSGNNLPEMSEGISTNGEKRRIHNATPISDGSTPKQTIDQNGSSTPPRPQSQEQSDREPCAFCKQYGTQAMGAYGFGSALKPSCEPITVARKPISEANLADNYLKWGVGGINIDGCRVGFENEKIDFTKVQDGNIYGGNGIYGKAEQKEVTKLFKETGRFPANLIHDGSDEVVELFPNDSARFFYSPKASKSERNRGCEDMSDSEPAYKSHRANYKNTHGIETPYAGTGRSGKDFKNFHPTVKPIALMEYLVKLVSKEGHTVLDPFMGSGSTGIACKKLGREFIGIELEPDYVEIAKARISAAEVIPEQEVLL